jgi:SAM-dependent methyltransferase
VDKITSRDAFKLSPYLSLKHSNYFWIYDNLLNRFQGTGLVFLEVGVLNGGSLFMWREYFGDNAKIIGIDNNPEALKWKEHGFEIFIGDQSNEAFWDEVLKSVGELDVVLDDGGHTYLQQIVTVNKLLPRISENGLIIIEDTHTSYANGFGSKKYSFIKYMFKIVNEINLNHFKGEDEARIKYISSISFFESIVALKINREIANTKSAPVSNNGISGGAFDMRHSKNIYMLTFQMIQRKLSFFKIIPGTKYISVVLWNCLGNLSSPRARLKKEFKKF